MIRTSIPAPVLRLITDNDKLVVVRKRDGLVYVHIEDLYEDDDMTAAELRPDQVMRLLEALQ